MPRLHVTLVALLASLAFSSAACADPCTDLQEVCDDCRDPNQKARCELSVDEDPDDVCELNVDAYRNVCR